MNRREVIERALAKTAGCSPDVQAAAVEAYLEIAGDLEDSRARQAAPLPAPQYQTSSGAYPSGLFPPPQGLIGNQPGSQVAYGYPPTTVLGGVLPSGRIAESRSLGIVQGPAPERIIRTKPLADDAPRRGFEEMIAALKEQLPRTLTVTMSDGGQMTVPLRFEPSEQAQMVRLTAIINDDIGPMATFSVYEQDLDPEGKVQQIVRAIQNQYHPIKEERAVRPTFQAKDFSRTKFTEEIAAHEGMPGSIPGDIPAAPASKFREMIGMRDG